MALKFLNKKGWHTGSLRNIENVWKAEQKHDAEQKKLEELRKQIQEERERNEFRLLQQQAGLVPSQERLEFLYDSGLAVGKSSSDGFNALEAMPKAQTEPTSSKQQASVPGALFEDKPQSANDTWRKLHSDPLLLIRQREQEALARIKNNPVQMARIHKSVEEKKKHKEEKHGKKEHKKHHKKSKHEKHSSKYQSDSEGAISGGEEERSKKSRQVSEHHKKSKHEKHSSKYQSDSEGPISGGEEERSKKSCQVSEHHKKSKHEKHSSKYQSDSEGAISGGEESKKSRRVSEHHKKSKHSFRGRSDSEGSMSEVEEERSNRSRHADDHPRKKHSSKGHSDFSGAVSEGEEGRSKRSHADERHRTASAYESENSRARTDVPTVRHGLHNKRSQTAPKLSAEEKAARAREMQLDAELHEEQRWKRLKKASEADAREANQARTSSSKNFLDAAQKSVYGTEKGGSSTIEESVRRRTYYLQGKSDREGNAFRR